MYQIFNNRQLHERSNLTFEFPGPNGQIKRSFIPFLENCDISESQKSNLAEYSLLARSGSIFSYLGAKSRSFNLTFKITFQHVVDTLGIEGINQRFKQIFTVNGSDDPKSLFFSDSSPGNKSFEKASYLNHARLHRYFYRSLNGTSSAKLKFINSALNLSNIANQAINYRSIGANGLASFPQLVETEDVNSINEQDKVINIILYWINLIRSSVKNNSKNTMYGCPIVRITHGPMYNNVPCVTDSYTIKIVQEAGYEIENLLPKQLEISMTLMEQRVGDFGQFESTNIIKGDNITGWESVIEENNMDPYNGLITLGTEESFNPSVLNVQVEQSPIQF